MLENKIIMGHVGDDIFTNGQATSKSPTLKMVDPAIIRFVNIDWKEVERRFDWLALVGRVNSGEPTIKWMEFGYCIGMEKSQEFASELLMALRGRRRDRKSSITKRELYRHWRRLTVPCFDSRIQIFFDICDRNMDGKICEADIRQAISLSAATNKLHLTHEMAKEQAALIMDILETKCRGYLEPANLAGLVNFITSRPRPPPSHQPQEPEIVIGPSKEEILLRSYWRRAWIVLLWLATCSSLFAWKFIQYRHRPAFQVMGYCLCTAKGAAETLKFNMAIILLPVCRNTITWLRRNPRISSVVPFNDNINLHKLIAGGIVVGVILHGGTHLACDFPRISSCPSSIFRRTIAPGFGYHQPSYVEILATTEVATGITMVVLMTIAFLLATKWTRRRSATLPRSVRQVTGYNTFWYSHHSLVLVYVLLLVHSMFLFLTDNMMEKTTWMYIAFPVLLYSGERIFRAVRSGAYQVKILRATIYPGKVLCLELQKPEGFKYKSGMYIYLQCPDLSSYQWHPFSLTSGPDDDHLTVHVRTLGDWSYQICGLFQEAILSRVQEFPKIHIDGPYGAASQDHVKYNIVMLIGLGIGATPFISILKDIANCRRKAQSGRQGDSGGECSIRKGPLKVYFHWVTREQSSFDWFRDSFREITRTNVSQTIEMHSYLTSVYQEGDARSILVRAMQALYLAKKGIDIVSQTKMRTHFSRPNWHSIFSEMATRHRGEQIGVFYCGPSTLARELENICTNFSTSTTTRFIFHKENY